VRIEEVSNFPPPGRDKQTVRPFGTRMKILSPRTRPEILLLLILGLAATTVTAWVSASSASIQSGVFEIRTENGALAWVGEPAGIPVWSPTENFVAWGNEDGLFLRALDEAGPRRLSTSAVAGVPGWSPDGKKLAYIDRDRASLVVVATLSGAEEFTQPLDPRPGDSARFPLLTLGGPAWAPDGSRIAYVCWDGIGDEICLIRSDGTGWRQLTRLELPKSDDENATPQSTRAASNTGPPAWSPQGRLLAVAVYPERPGAPTGVFLVDPEDGIGRRVSSLQPNSGISWSPDGGSILFSAFSRGRSDAFRVVLANSSRQRVTEGLPDGSRNPAFSPEGSRIAVETGGGIVVLGQQRRSQSFSVPGLRSSYPSWSPDGTAIAVAAAGDPVSSYN
jgi:Tol biopolymer transport system component